MHGMYVEKNTAYSSVLPASMLLNFTLLRCFVISEKKVIESFCYLRK